MELDREIEGRLPSNRGEDGVRPLADQDFLHDVGRERLDVGPVRVLGVGHDRRRVRVHQGDPDALAAERLDGLCPRIIEFAGLADHDRPGS